MIKLISGALACAETFYSKVSVFMLLDLSLILHYNGYTRDFSPVFVV